MSDRAPILRNYVWQERILVGQGAFCNAYRVKRRCKDDFVAIKEISLKSVDGIGDQIKNEIEVLKKMNHQHIVQLYDYYIGEDVAYEVLAYCEQTLRTLLQQNNGKLNEDQAVRIVVEVVEGMKELRKHGFAHRDLKPENILLHNGSVKICDFGLTVTCREGNRLLRYCGTPFYMSPQVVFKKYYTSKADIWSLGIIFYEILFGYTPWACRDEMSYKINIKENTLKFPFDTPIGTMTKDFITRCLQIEEEKRMSWEDVFNHPLIKKEQAGEPTHRYIMDKDTQPIMKCLQLKYFKDGQDVEDVFMRNSYEKLLNMMEFYQSYRHFYPLSFKQSRKLFEQADINSDGKVSSEELIKVLQTYDFEDGKDISSKIIRDIRHIILNNSVDVDKLFRQADLNRNGTLDLEELETLIRIVAPNIYSYDVRKVFQKVDLDKDGKISRHEVEIMLRDDGERQKVRGYSRTNSRSKKSVDKAIVRKNEELRSTGFSIKSKFLMRAIQSPKFSDTMKADQSTKATFSAKFEKKVTAVQNIIELVHKQNQQPPSLQKKANEKRLRTLLEQRKC